MTGKGRGDDIPDDIRRSIQLLYCVEANSDIEIPHGTHDKVAKLAKRSKFACISIWCAFKKTQSKPIGEREWSSTSLGNANAEQWPYSDIVQERLEYINNSLRGDGNWEMFYARYMDEFHYGQSPQAFLRVCGGYLKLGQSCAWLTRSQL